jgi:uncharacterized protein (DUF1501 family)
MNILKSCQLTRRHMLHRSGQLAVAGTAASYAMGLAGLGEAAAVTGQDEYKALVCIFLTGGNDHSNTLVPFDPANHSAYASIRGSLAIARESLVATALRTPDDQQLTNGIQYALAPTMPRLKALYDQGAAAILLNVGPLIAPLTKAQYMSENLVANPRPAKLFSHNDQQSTWQSSAPEGASHGWGGRMGDILQTVNQNAMFTNINATGNAVFLSGRSVSPFRVALAGATSARPLNSGRLFDSGLAGTALASIIGSHHQHVFEQDYARMTDRSIRYGSFINDALRTATVSTPFPAGNNLAAQLRIVARLIAARRSLGVRRQVFMVSLNAFDTHKGLANTHPGLLEEVDAAIDAFYRATVELGVAELVTTFTASDFGRTLTSNGDGSDHGWGSHHFIVGGDVNGGRYYGRAPVTSITSDDQVGQGRLLPTTSVDEYSTTLALWMGIPPSELPTIAPNIGRFANANIGFMTRPKSTGA